MLRKDYSHDVISRGVGRRMGGKGREWGVEGEKGGGERVRGKGELARCPIVCILFCS